MMDRLWGGHHSAPGIDNIIGLKAWPISSTAILKRPCQEKQQRAVISVVKRGGLLSDTELDAVICPCDRERPPSFLLLQDLFLSFLYLYFLLVSFNLFWLCHISTGGGDSSRYNQNQTHRTDWEKWQKGKNTGGKEKKKREKWFYLSYLF